MTTMTGFRFLHVSLPFRQQPNQLFGNCSRWLQKYTGGYSSVTHTSTAVPQISALACGLDQCSQEQGLCYNSFYVADDRKSAIV